MDGLVIEQAAIRPVSFPLATPRAIARGVETHAHVVEVVLAGAGVEGRGEACPMPRYGESVERVLVQFEAVRPSILSLTSRQALLSALSAGALRNAIDCALWDLEARQAGRPAEAIAGLTPQPVTTAYTISLLPPDQARAVADRERDRPLIKIKLGHFGEDEARVKAVRAGAPDAALIVDANEGWSFEQLRAIAPLMADLGVRLVEQPLPASGDAALLGYDGPIPLCADESCHTRASLDAVADRYGFINIKLDKTGGLTEALALADAAEARGLGLMVGSTSASTLAIAPAFLVAQRCAYADLDAALFLAEREEHEIAYRGSILTFSPKRTWAV